MKMHPIPWLLIVACTLAACGKATSSHEAEEKAATEAALAWLALVDEGSYKESWEQSAAPFKNSITPEKWTDMVKPVRAPLGKVESREVRNRDYMTELPGAPKGEYVIIQFKTQFENKKDAIETVTPMLEDGKWKVSGYYIK
jgi:Protein of unknown function (DUF4019)